MTYSISVPLCVGSAGKCFVCIIKMIIRIHKTPFINTVDIAFRDLS